MAKLVALYKKPADTTTFDAYYFAKQVPIAKRIPGLRGYAVSKGPVATPAGESPFHLVALLSFDSVAAIQQAMASPRGRRDGRRPGELRAGRRGSADLRYRGNLDRARCAAYLPDGLSFGST